MALYSLPIRKHLTRYFAALCLAGGICSPALAETATFYADYYIGRPTASGELYDARLLTAAHPSLPLGTYVRVWRGDRFVDVKINDRCNCDIDLSRAAANVLGITGIAEVTLEILYQPN